MRKRGYRKIWEEANGPIPSDHEIHHIDGDHSNNVIENLACLSLQEHYDTHYQQRDYFEAHLIGRRMKMGREVLNELIGKASRKRVQDGTHNWLDGEHARERGRQKVADGTHHFLTSDNEQKRLKGLRESKKHKAHLDGLNQRVLEAGNHTSQRKGTCSHCGKTMDIANLGRYHNDKCKEKQ